MAEENSLILNVQSDTVTKASTRLRTFAQDGDRAEKSIVGLSGQSNKAGTSLGKISGGGTRASRSLTDVSRESKKADRSLGMVSRAADSAKRSLGLMIVGAVGIGAISAAVGAATREWLQYDKAIKEVNSITSQTSAEFRTMRKDVLLLSTALGVDATKAARGLYQTLSSGVPKENALAFLEVASRTAIAGVTDVGTAVDGLTNTMNAFQIPFAEAELVADKLFSTVVNGKTTFEELSKNISKASVPAASLGVDLNELLGVTVAITKQGTGTAETFTQIKAVLTALNSPSKELLAVFEKMGVASARQAIGNVGLVGTLREIEQAYRDNDIALQKAAGGSDSFNAILSVTGRNAQTAIDAVDDISESNIKMADAAKENGAKLENSLNAVRSASILLVGQMESSFGIIQSFTLLLKGAANQIAEFSGDNLSIDTQTILNNPQQTIQNLQDIDSRLRDLTQTARTQKEELDNYNKAALLLPGGMVRYGQDVGDFKRNVSEIAALKEAYSGVSEELRLQYETQTRIEKIRNRKGVDKESFLEYEKFQNEELIRRLVLRRESIELEATQALANEKEKAAIEARGKAAAEQLAREKKNEEELAAAKKKAAAEEKKADENALDRAKDLITTDKQRIQLEIEHLAKLKQKDPANEATYSAAIIKLQEEIKLLDERNSKIPRGTGSPKGLSSSAAYGGGSFQPQSFQPLPDLYDPFQSRNQLDELDKQVEQIRNSYLERKAVILSLTSETEDEKNRLIQESQDKFGELMAKAERERNTIRLNLAADFFGNLSQIASVFGAKGAKVAKAAAITQTIIKTYESATSAYASLAGIPYIGPALGAAAAGAAIAAGFANVQAIRSQPVDAGAYATGGIVGGNNRSGDNMQARVNSGEMILNLGQQAKLFNIANGNDSSGKGQTSQPIVNVNVRTLPGTTAEVKQNPNNPEQLEIIIRKVDEAMASNLQTGAGKFVPALTRRIPALKQAT